jgi:hypothetical protein
MASSSSVCPYRSTNKMNAPDPIAILKLAQDRARNDRRPGEQQDCENCTRQGLAILPVRYALLPEVKGAKLPVGLTVDGPTVDPTVASYGLRALRKGYLYVYIEGKKESGEAEKRWDCYGVSPEGRLRGPYTPAVVVGKTDAFTCGRSEGGSHAVKASYITIPNAKLVSTAHFIFSQDPLSDETRAELSANTTRMQSININAWLGGSLPASTGAVGIDQLSGHVIEYMSNSLGADKAPLQTPWRDRSAEATSTPLLMTAAMQGKYAGRAMMLALHDRIGMVQELISARGFCESKLNELATLNTRQLFVASATENLRLDFEKRGKKKEWDDKYAKAYAKSSVDGFKTTYMKQYKPLEDKRNAYSKMWCDWMGDAHLSKVQNSLNNRYHPQSPMDCVNQTRTVADMLNGTGQLSAEAALWQKWMGSSTVNKDNLLDRAVSGGSASMIAFLTTRKDAAAPNVVDAFKSFYTAVDEWEKSNKMHADYIRRASQGLVPAGVDPREWAVRKGEPLFEGLHKFYQTMAGNVSQLKAGTAKHIRHAVFAGIFYFNVRFKPLPQNLTAAELAMDLKEVRWGTDAANKLLVLESTATKRVYQINTTEFMDIVAVDAKRLTVLQFHVHEVRTEAGLWVPAGNRTAGGIILPDGFVPSAATPNRVNGFLVAKQWTVGKVKGGGAVLGFSAIVLFFQYKAIEDSLQTLGDPNSKDQAKNDATLAIVGAAIGAAGALAEGAAAAWQLATNGVAISALTKLAAAGGFLGAISSAIAAWQTGAQAGRAWSTHDRDTAVFLGAAAGAFVVASVAGAAGAVSAFVGTAVWFGPVGWAVIAIGAVVIGIALMFGASLTKDDPLEAWLKQCFYGIATGKFNEKDEGAAFNKIFELPLDAKLTYDTQILGARHIIEALVTIPRLTGRAQKFDVELTVITVDGSGDRTSSVSGVVSGVETAQQVLAPGQTQAELQEIKSKQAQLSRMRLLFDKNWELDAQDAKYEIKRVLEFNNMVDRGISQPFVKQATLSVKYWPDHTKNPELVLPGGGGPGGTPVTVTVPR